MTWESLSPHFNTDQHCKKHWKRIYVRQILLLFALPFHTWCFFQRYSTWIYYRRARCNFWVLARQTLRRYVDTRTEEVKRQMPVPRDIAVNSRRVHSNQSSWVVEDYRLPSKTLITCNTITLLGSLFLVNEQEPQISWHLNYNIKIIEVSFLYILQDWNTLKLTGLQFLLLRDHQFPPIKKKCRFFEMWLLSCCFVSKSSWLTEGFVRWWMKHLQPVKTYFPCGDVVPTAVALVVGCCLAA